MKVFTNTFDLAKASPHRFWVAPYSDFKIGIKILAKGEVVDKDFTVKAGAVELTPDEDKIDGFTLYTLKSGDTGFVEYTIEIEDIAEKLKLTQIVTDSTVFEIGGGGGDVPADVATKTWVNSQISDFVEEDALTAYATKDELTAYAETSDLTAYVPLTGNVNMTGSLSVANDSNGVELDSSNGVTVWDIDEGKRKAISLDYDGLFVKDYDDTAAKEIEYPTKSGTMVVDADLTAYYTKSETSSATELADAFAGAGGGGAISAFDLSESPVWSKTQVEAALANNICLPQTIVQYHDNSLSVLDIEGTLSGTFNQFNSPVQVKNANNSRPKKVIVGTKVTQVTDSAFQGFGSNDDFFEEIVLPDSVIEIGERVFNGNYKLTKFRMSNNLSSIGGSAFTSCIKIPVLELPDSVQTMGPIGFNGIIDTGNTRKTVISSTATYPSRPIGPSAKLYVPDSLYATWISTSNWSDYASQIHRRSELEAPYATSTAVSALTAANNKVTGGAETGTTGTPAAVNAVKSVYETDWATLSATADANTFYVVVPDPE